MITVIIPAFNEEKTIGKVVQFCFKEPLVSEVIVVDDRSTDTTRLIAENEGAVVIISEKRGKGTSMKEGVQFAANQLLVFLDADIDPYPAGTLSVLVQPIIDNECDFVKGAFTRNAGRVTELVAKPLLKIFYPELCTFQQPLSGMIAGKKFFLEKIDFFHDYGVDIGILIDMFLMHARIKEVNIGYIENKSKPWRMLGKMSGEVAKAIVKKATHKSNKLGHSNDINNTIIRSVPMEYVIKNEMLPQQKMFVFDMDNTILEGSFIEACAEKYLFDEEIVRLRSIEHDSALLTKRIAKLLKGLSRGDLLQVAASIPLVKDTIAVVKELKGNGNIVGIISDSYDFIVEYIKNKIGADFALGNQLDFFEGKATGEVTIPSYFYHYPESKCKHSLCKTNALLHAVHKYNIGLSNCVSIGDSINDLCMIEQSGIGVAFCTKNISLRTAAHTIIDKRSFSDLVDGENLIIPTAAAI